MIVQIPKEYVVFDKAIKALCGIPYYDHPKGCPYFNTRETCMGNSPLIDEVLDLERELFVIYTPHIIGTIAEKTRLNNPQWTEKSYPDHPKKTAISLEKIENKLREKHPEWPEAYYVEKNSEPWKSSRAWYNLRYWQGTARSEHKDDTLEFFDRYPKLDATDFPEGLGVNVTALMHNIGVKMNWQWPPIHDLDNITYRISIGGHRLKGSSDVWFVERE